MDTLKNVQALKTLSRNKKLVILALLVGFGYSIIFWPAANNRLRQNFGFAELDELIQGNPFETTSQVIPLPFISAYRFEVYDEFCGTTETNYGFLIPSGVFSVTVYTSTDGPEICD